MNTDIKDPELKKPTPALYDTANINMQLQKFFIDSLKDIYWAEQELEKSLPKLKSATTAKELVDSIDHHLHETRIHVQRLAEIFSLLSTAAEAKKCFAMEGLLKEADSIVEETEQGSATRDAAIILAAQKVEHYEIATYGSLVEYAKTMGLNEIKGLLQATLEEEKMADQGLTLIAQNKINWTADLEGLKKSEVTVR